MEARAARRAAEEAELRKVTELRARGIVGGRKGGVLGRPGGMADAGEGLALLEAASQSKAKGAGETGLAVEATKARLERRKRFQDRAANPDPPHSQ